ncbi:hypothetical protein ACFE04_014395 [Oxalis oulophora]
MGSTPHHTTPLTLQWEGRWRRYGGPRLVHLSHSLKQHIHIASSCRAGAGAGAGAGVAVVFLACPIRANRYGTTTKAPQPANPPLTTINYTLHCCPIRGEQANVGVIERRNSEEPEELSSGSAEMTGVDGQREGVENQEPEVEQVGSPNPVESNNSDDVIVCDICGGEGNRKRLAICSNCPDGAQHTYCMRVLLHELPGPEWMCEDCEEAEKRKVEVDEASKKAPSMKGKTPDLNVKDSSAAEKSRKGDTFSVGDTVGQQLSPMKGKSPGLDVKDSSATEKSRKGDTFPVGDTVDQQLSSMKARTPDLNVKDSSAAEKSKKGDTFSIGDKVDVRLPSMKWKTPYLNIKDSSDVEKSRKDDSFSEGDTVDAELPSMIWKTPYLNVKDSSASEKRRIGGTISEGDTVDARLPSMKGKTPDLNVKDSSATEKSRKDNTFSEGNTVDAQLPSKKRIKHSAAFGSRIKSRSTKSKVSRLPSVSSGTSVDACGSEKSTNLSCVDNPERPGMLFKPFQKGESHRKKRIHDLDLNFPPPDDEEDSHEKVKTEVVDGTKLLIPEWQKYLVLDCCNLQMHHGQIDDDSYVSRFSLLAMIVNLVIGSMISKNYVICFGPFLRMIVICNAANKFANSVGSQCAMAVD